MAPSFDGEEETVRGPAAHCFHDYLARVTCSDASIFLIIGFTRA